MACDLCKRRAPTQPCSLGKERLELCASCMTIFGCAETRASRRLEPDVDLINSLKRKGI